MSRILYFDCFAGAAGDMILGALIDAGLPLAELRSALGSLAIGSYDIDAERVTRAGVGAVKFRVRDHHEHHHHNHAHHDHPPDHDEAQHKHNHSHDHEHDHGYDHTHAHRTLAEIASVIDRSALSNAGKARARSLFQRLAEVEAAIHQIPVEKVHLHEVGALDSIIDITGAVFAMEWFAADRVIVSPLNVGSGTVVCEHGTFPVPAPATARLLTGVPVYSSGIQAELVTPTGALLITEYAAGYGPVPPMKIAKIGYGAGDRDIHGFPNVLRVLVGEDAGGGSVERVLVLECEIDDMNPQIFGVLMDRLHAAGALDVFYAPIQMKKNRPGTLVSIIARPEDREALSGVVFKETTTLGLRHQEMYRERLEREVISVQTPLGAVRFKIARRGGGIVNAAPEFDDCARLAAERGLSIKEVQAIATKAYLDWSGRNQ